MRTINISNEKKRNAQVGFEVKRQKSGVEKRRKDGAAYESVRLLKSTIDTEPEDLLRELGGVEAVADAILKGDPECDTERVGMRLGGMKKVFLTPDDRIAYRLRREEVLFLPDGTEKEARPWSDAEANINLDSLPIRWTGKLIPKEKAVRMFVFAKKYQVKHVNGLTYDFLYDMARQLVDKRALMLVGGGEKGNQPLVMTTGGVAYRAFLEGRVEGEKYTLILHLTNLEMKSIL